MAEKCSILSSANMRYSWPTLMAVDEFRGKFHDMRDKNSCTPDILELQNRNGHLLFVYGTLKAGFSRESVLYSDEARFIATGVTNHVYSLYYQPNRKDPFPVLLPAKIGQPAGNIVGQLYIVSPKKLIEIDAHEANTRLYHRLKMNIQIVTKPIDKNYQIYSTLYAWAYMGIPGLWKPMIETHDIQAIKPSGLYGDSERQSFISFNKSMENPKYHKSL
jgi:gamma-glutamylcyclotransferase (GGCT)/AIG2-like uncharacterized protein YtfP